VADTTAYNGSIMQLILCIMNIFHKISVLPLTLGLTEISSGTVSSCEDMLCLLKRSCLNLRKV